jgi:hypothetical protein
VVGLFRVEHINGFAAGQTTLIVTDSVERMASEDGGIEALTA